MGSRFFFRSVSAFPAFSLERSERREESNEGREDTTVVEDHNGSFFFFVLVVVIFFGFLLLGRIWGGGGGGASSFFFGLPYFCSFLVEGVEVVVVVVIVGREGESRERCESTIFVVSREEGRGASSSSSSRVVSLESDGKRRADAWRSGGVFRLGGEAKGDGIVVVVDSARGRVSSSSG